MGEIRLPGLLTGIDTETLISQLMAIESRTLSMYQIRQTLWERKKSAISTLESKLTSLKSSLQKLSDDQKLRAYSTASSDEDVLTAEASHNAFEGTPSIII